ncbi:MAG: putative toxin-antitoxin system toxin component, PIN family [Myxococcaceae bacterium]|nr:putative toxin-antitoxin system toxin component, PIN family [Myxococcaceae bacterium]MCI0673699.1 putative toxin-antitoxin system toxin component, PIN family [Myxococcaceae bacterium]
MPPLPIVLDTNVVLDMLVFDDAFSRPLAEALTSGELVAWADERTLTELGYVLSRPGFALGAAAQQALLARYRGLVRMAPEDAQASLPELPRCKDRSDQKFLVLAARAGATWLISKDKQLLQLAGRQGLPFLILTPRRAVQHLVALR